MADDDKIPTSLIGLLSRIIPDYYTRATQDALFLYAGTPVSDPDLSKAKAVVACLRGANSQNAFPMKVLGIILDDFMATDVKNTRSWGQTTPSEQEIALEKCKADVRETLTREGFSYVKGGTIVKAGTSSTLTLFESVKKHGLSTVEIEITRALAQIEEDPHAAAHYAGNVLEAAIKVYLDHKSIQFTDKDTLSPLWKLASDAMGLNSEDWDDKDLKLIGTGLNNIVSGIMYIRNRKSAAHGRSFSQAKIYVIKPRHARLAIHSAHTVAAYLIELTE